MQHPELFKYSGDQTDKEWLAKASLMATTGGKVNNTLLILMHADNCHFQGDQYFAGSNDNTESDVDVERFM